MMSPRKASLAIVVGLALPSGASAAPLSTEMPDTIEITPAAAGCDPCRLAGSASTDKRAGLCSDEAVLAAPRFGSRRASRRLSVDNYPLESLRKAAMRLTQRHVT